MHILIIYVWTAILFCLRLSLYAYHYKRFVFRSTMWNILVLCPILGITWVFGVLSFNNDLVAFQYIFAIVNSLQVVNIILVIIGNIWKLSIPSYRVPKANKIKISIRLFDRQEFFSPTMKFTEKCEWIEHDGWDPEDPSLALPAMRCAENGLSQSAIYFIKYTSQQLYVMLRQDTW